MAENLILFTIKFLLVSTSLILVYVLLFKDKASYIQQRLMLLSIPILSILASTFSFNYIPVGGGSAEIIEIISSSLENASSTPELNIISPIVNEEITHIDVAIKKESKFILTPLEICGIVYLLVILIFVLVSTVSTYKLHRIRKFATKYRAGNIKVYRSGLVETPFSFMRSIYSDRKLSGEKLTMILQHEGAHIASRHYIDRIIIEFFLAAFWFNPLIWYIKREICKIHEFESDFRVLNQGNDRTKYQQFLIEELTPSIPYMANGFGDSLIKKRFIQMKNSYKIRYKTVRTIMTLPLIIFFFTITAFTYAKEDVITTEAKEIYNNIEEKTMSLYDTEPIVKVDEPVIDSVENKVNIEDTIIIDSVDVVKQDTIKNTLKDALKRDKNTYRVTRFSDGVNQYLHYINSEDDLIKIDTIPIPKEKIVEDTSRYVTLFYYDENGNIIEKRKIEKAFFNKTDTTSKVKQVKLPKAPKGFKILEDALPNNYDPNSCKALERQDNGDKNYILELPSEIVYYNLPKEKMNPYLGTKDLNTRIESIVSYEDKTVVTLVVYIPSDPYWFSISKNTALVDNKSSDRYMIHSIKHEIPLNYPILITRKKGNVLVFSLTFPPLKNGVNKVDFIEFNDPDINLPNHQGSGYRWSNIKVIKSKKAMKDNGIDGEVIRMGEGE